MSGVSRRTLLGSLALAAIGQGSIAKGWQRKPGASQRAEKAPEKLALEDYLPTSMLHVAETKVSRSRFPLIDFHTHLSWSTRRGRKPELKNNMPVEEVLVVMDRKNVRTMVNLTGGYGPVLEQAIAYWQKPHPDRFIVFTEPWFEKIREANYSQFQADQISHAHALGAKGVKLLKTLGLYLREQITTGPLVKIDDRRFDQMWEAAGANRMPIAIHTSDPEAFFLPTDRFNERYEELSAHPDWSFHGKDFPSNAELMGREIVSSQDIQGPSSSSYILVIQRTLATCRSCWIDIQTSILKLEPGLGNSVDSLAQLVSFSISIRIAFSSEPTPSRTATKRLNRSSESDSTRSITDFLRQRMSTSTTHRHRNHRRGDGAFMESDCQNQFCVRFTTKTLRAC